MKLKLKTVWCVFTLLMVMALPALAQTLNPQFSTLNPPDATTAIQNWMINFILGHPAVATLVGILVALRGVMKPLMTIVESKVAKDPAKAQQLADFEHGPAFGAVAFVLDWLCSIKLKPAIVAGTNVKSGLRVEGGAVESRTSAPPTAVAALVAVLAGCVLAGGVLTGCMTSTSTTVDPTTGKTNTVTTVNQANLALDAGMLQAATATSVSLLTAHDASLIPILKDTQIALDGILNGSNPTTTQQVLTALKAQGNAALTSEITSLLGTASGLEQSMLANLQAGKYGSATVAGQITVALTRAVDGGLIVGLAGK